MKNIRIKVVWLLLCGLCLGACGPATEKKESEESTVAQQTEMKEKEEQETGSFGTEEQPAESETPCLLSLLTRTETNYVWGDSKRLCHTGYPRLWLDTRIENSSQCGALAFPELAAALEEMNARSEETAAATIKELETLAREMETDAYFYEPYWEENLWVTRADSQILSVLKWGYSYTGGAHGMYGYTGITLDSQSGKEMELEEIVTDPYYLAELVSRRLVEKYPDVPFGDSLEETLIGEMGEGYLTWVAGYDGIMFYFDPYELVPYAYGAQSVTILYGEEPGLFTDQVCQVPESWAVSLVPDTDYDLGKDKTLDTIEVFGASIEAGDAYNEFTVSVNGQKSVQKDLWFYRYTPYLVHSDRLKTDLLMIETVSDNDYEIIMIFDLNPDNKGFQTPWQFTSTGFYRYYRENEDGTYEYGDEIFSNPDHFRLNTRLQLLSTYSGVRWYGLCEDAGDDGYLKPEQPWYDVDRGDYPLTLLVPLEMETGDQGETRTYPEGTRLWIVRTDGEYVEFLTEDNRLCRVYMESTDWPGWIKGVEDKDITEIFDGMMFAG